MQINKNFYPCTKLVNLKLFIYLKLSLYKLEYAFIIFVLVESEALFNELNVLINEKCISCVHIFT